MATVQLTAVGCNRELKGGAEKAKKAHAQLGSEETEKDTEQREGKTREEGAASTRCRTKRETGGDDNWVKLKSSTHNITVSTVSLQAMIKFPRSNKEPD